MTAILTQELSLSIPPPASSTGRAATPESTFCTVDMSRVPEEHASEATLVALRKLVEHEIRAPGDQLVGGVLRSPGMEEIANRLRIMGRSKEELSKIKDILEAKNAPGARVVRDQLYPVKVDNVNRAAIIDHGGKILLGAAEALGQGNDMQPPRTTAHSGN
ncbi:hypothetical protein MMYC01_206278 [Madurella mycetomatis]|uniref:Uncharacterized protein n=1 Tax=Madurella mycetomatis TaxID=100816 RepID=A0A175W5Y4_9PEZI|nr:hypothetical protein MMYC01_206638 [Madurella mycetomatis]KXX78985.1 hypothetical protein MMYC01_206278 [Madurella mycetomatis]